MNHLKYNRKCRKRGNFDFGYTQLGILHSLSDDSFVFGMDIKSNTLLIRTYSPEGYTPGGLYVVLNDKNARVWGFVLKVAQPNRHNLSPGDLIVFERHYDMLLAEDDSREKDVKHPISILHEDCVVAIIRNSRVPVPM